MSFKEFTSSLASSVLATLISSAIIVAVASYFLGSSATVPVSIAYSGMACSIPDGAKYCNPTLNHRGIFSGSKFDWAPLRPNEQNATDLENPVFRRFEIGLRETARNLTLRISCELADFGGVKNALDSELQVNCPIRENGNVVLTGDPRLQTEEPAIRDFTLNLLGTDASAYHLEYQCKIRGDSKIYTGRDGQYCVGSDDRKVKATTAGTLEEIRIRIVPITWWERIRGASN